MNNNNYIELLFIIINKNSNNKIDSFHIIIKDEY